MFSLQGKKALVTGAASGIGASIAQIFAEAGAQVGVADRDLKGAEQVAEKIRGRQGHATALSLDVTDTASCGHAAQTFGPVDILVNNAGIGSVGTLLETTGEDMDRLYAVNVRGVFNVSKAFLPAMIEAGSGNIINLASVGGVVGIRDRLAYCTTKFAVVGMTKSMALDHAAAGIRVNCICPGRVETPFVSARLKEYPDPEKAYREMSSTQLFGRMIKPEEIAAAALYLASDESYMVTGSHFLIDCGWTAG
jgi:2-keto-3-deoxy-L-fuconate dehydrogenase